MEQLVSLSIDQPIWERFFSVFPLVLVGSREQGGGHDLAPKHMAMPMGWQNLFGFVCTPRHRTYHNILRNKVFTVSYPHPEQVVLTSLAAAPRSSPQEKPALSALPVFDATTVDGVLVKDCALYLECELERMVDELDDNSLIIGRIVAAQADVDILRAADREDSDLVHQHPLLAYLHPNRFAVIERSQGFPLPMGFKR